MLLAAFIAVSQLLPHSAAAVWSDVLCNENARLIREVEELELKEMVRRYRAGQRLRVAEWRGSPFHPPSTIKLSLNDAQIRWTVLEGRIAPDALWGLIIERAIHMKQIEKEIENDRRATRQYEEKQEMWNRLKSGVRRPRVDPDQFPELSRLVRQNLDLWARKRNPGW